MDKAQQSASQWPTVSMTELYLTDMLRPLADSTSDWKFPKNSWELGHFNYSQVSCKMPGSPSLPWNPPPRTQPLECRKVLRSFTGAKLVSVPERGLGKDRKLFLEVYKSLYILTLISSYRVPSLDNDCEYKIRQSLPWRNLWSMEDGGKTRQQSCVLWWSQ